MDNLVSSAVIVLPMLIMMIAGYVVKKATRLSDDVYTGMSKLVYNLFLPCMMFRSALNSDFRTINARLLLFVMAGVAVLFALYLLIVPRIEKNKEDSAVIIHALFRSNTAIYGIPLAIGLMGDGNIADVLVVISIIVLMYNVLGVTLMESIRLEKTSFWSKLLSVAKNPLIIAGVLGVVLSLLRVTLPAFVDSAFSSLGAVAAPLGFICIGASLDFSSQKQNISRIIWVCLLKLIVVPAIVLSLGAFVFGFRGIELVALLVVFATPTAVSTFSMAQTVGANSRLAGEIVVYTTLFSIFTLFMYIFLCKQLGVA